MAPNVCCDIKAPQAVDNKIASTNLQRRLINLHFFSPFKLNQRERSRLMERMVWQIHPQDLCSVLKLLRPCLGWEWSLEFHVTHKSMRHASPSQPGSQCCLLCLTKFLEFPGLQRCLYLLQPFVPSLRPLGGANCFGYILLQFNPPAIRRSKIHVLHGRASSHEQRICRSGLWLDLQHVVQHAVQSLAHRDS